MVMVFVMLFTFHLLLKENSPDWEIVLISSLACAVDSCLAQRLFLILKKYCCQISTEREPILSVEMDSVDVKVNDDDRQDFASINRADLLLQPASPSQESE